MMSLWTVVALLGLCCVGHADLGYSLQSLQHERWLLAEKLNLNRESIPLLDAQVEYQVAALPGKISQAMEDISNGIQETNHEYGGIVSAIVVGRVIRILSATIADTAITAGDVLLNVVGPAFLSASFAASRVARIMNPNIECNLSGYHNILSQYRVLTSLRSTYSTLGRPQPQKYSEILPTYGSQAPSQPNAGESLSPGLQPCVLKHNARDGRTSFKVCTYCFIYLQGPGN